MLIYANHIQLDPEDGAHQIIKLIARWIKQKTNVRIDIEKLAFGQNHLKFNDGSQLSSKTTQIHGVETSFPYLFCAKYTHRDYKTAGRRWITEIGIKQLAHQANIECSILVKTEEISAKIVEPAQASRPKIIIDFFESCRPVPGTPGLFTKKLDVESAPAFLMDIERPERNHSLIILSQNQNGKFSTEPERLRNMVLGLADVILIKSDTDINELERIIPSIYLPNSGLTKIIYQKRLSDKGFFHVKTHYESQEEQRREDVDQAMAILADVTHRSNVSNSFRHISSELVADAVLRNRIYRTLNHSNTEEKPLEISEYVELLEEADKELQANADTISHLKFDLEERGNELHKTQAEVESLMIFKSKVIQGTESTALDLLVPIRTCLESLNRGSIKLFEALSLVGALYPDRVIILESAMASAKESDKAMFEYGPRAYELLSRLAGDYWQTLIDGGSDQQAKEVFGQNIYTAKEGRLSANGLSLRTFSYRGKAMFMEKHLRYGIKDSAATTLRIHFEWIADEGKIVIGHCGKHLNP
jgi:hypothetical protein